VAKNALGRGLDALLGDAEESSGAGGYGASFGSVAGGAALPELPAGIERGEDGVLLAPVDRLVPNPHQMRREFEPEALEELADSIRENGLIQPITIEDAQNGSFFIIAGERRTRAAKLAGLTKIPVLLKKFSDRQKLEIALIENIQREDLNPLEEAQAYAQLMELSGLNQEDVAKRVGKKRSTIANAVRLLRLPDDMRQALIAGSLSAGHARALLSVTGGEAQRGLFERVIADGLSVREAEQYAQILNAGGSLALLGGTSSGAKKSGLRIKNAPPEESSRDPDLTFIEQKFIDVLGTKVDINGDFDKGSIQIDYFSRDDLDRLYEIIAK
jgi:ParB family chromosome partitioning protein